LKSLADAGLGATSVLANLHHRQIVLLMEKELHIYEMSEAANPMLLAHLRLLNDHFPLEYAATRARCAISLKARRHSNDDLWLFVTLPDAPTVSRLSSFPRSLKTHRCDLDSRFLADGDRGCLVVRPAHALSLSGCLRRAAARAGAGCAQEGEEDLAAGATGALSPDYPREFVVVIVVVVGGGGERWGAGSP
jgi:hypothetical protein